jgi:integrase
MERSIPKITKPRKYLPAFVSVFNDRHGKPRYRFRRKGCDARYINAELGSEEFLHIYHECMEREPKGKSVGSERVIPGTIADLVSRYYRSTDWARKTPGAKDHDRRIIDRFREDHADKRVALLTFEHVDAILAKKSGTPTAANKLRKQLKRLFGYAVAIDMLAKNPMDRTKPMPVRRGGYHAWTEEEIAQYQARHPYGTKARLALELMLWTGQRKSDSIRIGRQHIKDGRIRVVQEKTEEPLLIPVAPQLLQAITSMPVHGHMTYLVTEYGAPFTPNGFGNWFRDRCNEAELPQCSAHGLRKSMARRLANLNQSNQSIKSITGHKTDSEVARYTRDANQVALADAAIAALSQWEMSNRSDERCLTSP